MLCLVAACGGQTYNRTTSDYHDHLHSYQLFRCTSHLTRWVVAVGSFPISFISSVFFVSISATSPIRIFFCRTPPYETCTYVIPFHHRNSITADGVAAFDSLSDGVKDSVCHFLVLSINWFRETTNAFADQTESDYRLKVVCSTPHLRNSPPHSGLCDL